MTDDKAALRALDLSAAEWVSAADATGEGQVEIASLPGGAVAMRKSDEPETVLRFTAGEWTAFVLGAQDGEFDLS